MFTVILAMLVLTGANNGSAAALSPEQASLMGVESMTVHASCSEVATELGFSEQEIQENIAKQIETAGIKVRPPQAWDKLPGRCRLRVAVRVYKPDQEDMFVYNLKVDFLQSVTLDRNPHVRIEAATWELMWFAHGSKSRLAQTIPQNLEVLAASFIRDYYRANPDKDGAFDPEDPAATLGRHSGANPGSSVAKHGFVGSKTSDVFHKPDCRWIVNISPENLVTYQSRKEATAANKRPCKWCNP